MGLDLSEDELEEYAHPAAKSPRLNMAEIAHLARLQKPLGDTVESLGQRHPWVGVSLKAPLEEGGPPLQLGRGILEIPVLDGGGDADYRARSPPGGCQRN